MQFRFGVEHEVAFLNAAGEFIDSSHAGSAQFSAIIDRLPLYPDDYPQLRVGDAKIRHKRWYAEGLERFSDTGEALCHASKGIEIRTTIHTTIQGAVDELSASFDLLRAEAGGFSLAPALISFNPHLPKFTPNPPFNAYELAEMADNPDELTAHIHMLSYGPDMNLSAVGLSTAELIDIGQKLTYYSPVIVPFSFSSPFYAGGLWEGLSVRTYLRTGQRAAAYVFVEYGQDIIPSLPGLTKLARIPAEIGRIEFKAFDSCDDFALYAGFLALLKGLILDRTLAGRALTPDPEAHQHCALRGFADEGICGRARQVLQAAERALGADADARYLRPLHEILAKRSTQAHALIAGYRRWGSIAAALAETYPPGLPMNSLPSP